MVGVGGQRHVPAALSRERDTAQTVEDSEWAPGPVWRGVESLVPTGIRHVDRPARSQSVYRVCYPSPQMMMMMMMVIITIIISDQ